MSETFPGFSPQALSFLRALSKNNTREWFTPRKELFEELLRDPMLRLVESINDDLRAFSADHVTEPKKAVYRIYRDTRFSKDKTPYKTHVAANFPARGLPKHAGAGFYFHVAPGELLVAGGMYMPGPPEVAAVRKMIADDPATWRKLVTAANLCKQVGELLGDKLTRVPKGFAADHPAGEYLRMKNWYFGISLPVKLATTPAVRKQVVSRFKVMLPFIEGLNIAARTAAADGDEGEARPKRPEPMF